ncbi:MAG TPA: SBBP repeat-containing protein, partial [Stenomitos sp.]
ILNPKFDPLHRLERQDKTKGSKVKVGNGDAWVAKYQVGSNGVRKVLWKKQLGTLSLEESYGVATDRNGNVFITGFTFGSLGSTNQGYRDVWVAKYSPDGTLVWVKQLGTPGADYSYDVATDSNGNVFISGRTNGALEGTYKGQFDAWVAKYSPDGTLVWVKQLGTPYVDYSYSIATDRNGNVFITGLTGGTLGGTSYNRRADAWVAKYSSDGVLKWVKQLFTSGYEQSFGVTTDSQGNVFITGTTDGIVGDANQGGIDAWVVKYGPGGALQWKQQLGSSSSSNDYCYGVATDSQGNVFITGTTDGTLGGTQMGYGDAWVAKYSPNGALRWTKQLGSSSSDYSYGVATDAKGNVFITGSTNGTLGSVSQGIEDAWVAKFSPYGKQLWLRQDGTPSNDAATGVAVDSNGDVLVTGYTTGNFARD